MTLSMYDASVAVFEARLKSLSKFLAKAEADAVTRKIDPQVLLNARLAPDMLSLTKQVQIATDHAKGAASRLAGREIEKFDDNETTFGELAARIARAIDLLSSFKPEEFAGSEDKTIELKLGPNSMSFPGKAYLFDFALPNFYFHLATAYNILRHNGAPLGKRDFLT